MKRLLLFSIVLATTGSLLAQTTQKYVPFESTLFSTQLSNDHSLSLNGTATLRHPDFVYHPSTSSSLRKSVISRSSGVEFYPFASSGNAYTLFHSQSNCLQANTDLNLIMFTHRACVYYINNGGNIGWINTSFSTDGGVTWDTTVLPMHVGKTATDTGCRYPSGAIYNPVGNTIANQAYGVVSGPYTNNTNWTGYYFGSRRLDTSFDNEQVYPIADTPATFNEYWPNVATTTAGNKVFVLGVEEFISATSTLSGILKNVVLNTGTFNAASKSFSWTQQNIHIPVAIKPQDTSLVTSNPVDTIQYISPTASSDMAWSLTGDTGYIVQFGVDSAQLYSTGSAGYYPIVYKSIDSGKTWLKLPFFAFSADTNITKFLLLNQDGGYSPFIGATNGSKCIVDYKGNLHIFTDIESGYSNNGDSLDYTYAPVSGNVLPQYIYDLSTSDGTTWSTVFVDSILSQPGASQQWTSTESSIFTDARVQAAATVDRTKVFVTWLDSNPDLDGVNDFPDIYSKGIDYTDNYITPVVNFTANSAQAEGCYWLYVSTTAFSNSGIYTIPATISLPGNGNTNFSTDDAMEHFFVSGITFTDSDFSATGIAGIAPIAKSNLGITVYPTPTNGDLNVSFTQYTGQATIFVTNIIGSVVKQFNNVNIADNQVSLNLEDLQSGIYFVRIETAQGSETQKIVIAKN